MILGFLLLLLALLFPPAVYAKFDPLSVPNNKYGIHLLDPNDIFDAARLVNSTGGKWGYVTIVIQEDDRNKDKWQGFFDELRRLHLIPLVRVATKIQGDSWAKPQPNGIDDWVRFLDSLNWPIENKYVILYNETNHAKEWGNDINPEEYARFIYAFAQKLHGASDDFFVLPGGMDVSAASDGHSLDALEYMKRMHAAQPDIFNVFDGWTSHSYPNPGFSGSPFAQGRGTLRSFLWEQSTLASMGFTKKLPVFITETGWIHDQGAIYSPGLMTSDAIGANLIIAANSVWNDPNIVAVTPFALSYQGIPFDHFSWKRLGVDEFYPQYYRYKEISKTMGQPKQIQKYELSPALIPPTLVSGSRYVLQSTIKNMGQAILSAEEGYTLKLAGASGFQTHDVTIPSLEPNRTSEVFMTVETPNNTDKHEFDLELTIADQTIVLQSGSIQLVPPPSAKVSMQLGWRTINNAKDVTVLVYDHNTLLHKIQGLDMKGGDVTIKDLRNIVPGNSYRVVALVPYYLPRQTIVKLGKDETTVKMPRLYPLDFNNDGHWSLQDLWTMFQMRPNQIFALFAGA